jgi:L-ascorbate metabolism protein UlaG (beta-lactamase superfamily)
MKVKWLGHASFLITSEDGKKIIMDPYTVARGIHYDPINEAADVVTISHDHGDHNNDKAITGNPEVIKGEGSRNVKGIEFRGISSHHDDAQGSKRGNNTIFCFTIDGIRICHLGDLGHPLNDKQIADIGAVDMLFIPVGGHFTIDASQATALYQSLKPRVTIPMHYKTPKSDYPIATVDEFLQGKENARKVNSSEVEYEKGTLPQKAEILVLQHAL